MIKAILFVFALALSTTAQAAKVTTTCSDSYGDISVVNGNVDIKNGIGDVGMAVKQKTLALISDQTENCVEGANYVKTKIFVQEVTYEGDEEGSQGTAVVLCTQVRTGKDRSCQP